jgi:hypothetical protein
MPELPNSFIGKPNLIDPQRMIALSIDLILGAWPRVCNNTEINRESDEPFITYILYHELRQEKENRGISDRPPKIIGEASEYGESRKKRVIKRIDFQFHYDWDDSAYWGLECKKVKDNDTTSHRDYAMKGVYRFISAEYCRGHKNGGMLAIVVGGTIIDCEQKISNSLRNHRDQLKLQRDWSEVTDLGNINYLFSTFHLQESSELQIRILHLFLELT